MMELIGKCKKDFEEWLLTDQSTVVCYPYSIMNRWSLFEYLTDSMKFGVFVDFADSVGFRIEVMVGYDFDKTNGYFYDINDCYCSGIIKSRPEARTAAIKKFNELYSNGK